MREEVRQAFIDHYKRIGKTHEQIFGDPVKESCERDMELPFSLLADESMLNHSAAKGGFNDNFKMVNAITEKGTPFSETIVKMYRHEYKSKEWITYVSRYDGKDYLGNTATQDGLPYSTHRTQIGYYEIPVWRKFNKLTASGPTIVESDGPPIGVEPVYEIEWTPAEIKKLEPKCSSDCLYYLKDKEYKFRVKDPNEWKNTPRETIVKREMGFLTRVAVEKRDKQD